MLEAKQSRLPLFTVLSLIVHILFLSIQSQETILASIKTCRSDRAICIALKNVTTEEPSQGLIEKLIASYPPTRLADIKPVPTVVEHMSVPVRIQPQKELPLPRFTQHSRANSVLFTPQEDAAPVRVDSSAKEAYLRHIRGLLEAAKQYPESARRGEIEGSVGIGFCINRQGYLVRNVEVFRSSGSPALDQASVACVKKVAQFPPLPDIFQEDLLKIRVNIVFKLRGQS
jgi:TonB family protein